MIGFLIMVVLGLGGLLMVILGMTIITDILLAVLVVAAAWLVHRRYDTVHPDYLYGFLVGTFIPLGIARWVEWAWGVDPTIVGLVFLIVSLALVSGYGSALAEKRRLARL